MVAIRLLRQFVIPVDYSGMIYQPAEAKQADGVVVSTAFMLVFFWKWKARKDGGQVFMGQIRDGRKSMRSCRQWREEFFF